MAAIGQYNLDEMTRQEVFEASCTHLLVQSKKSVGGNYGELCHYNGDGGVCCAAAIFVQDYKIGMEGKTWSGLVRGFGQTKKYTDLVNRLQSLHDNRSVVTWSSDMHTLASDYELDTTFLEPWYWDEDSEKYAKKES